METLVYSYVLLQNQEFVGLENINNTYLEVDLYPFDEICSWTTGKTNLEQKSQRNKRERGWRGKDKKTEENRKKNRLM